MTRVPADFLPLRAAAAAVAIEGYSAYCASQPRIREPFRGWLAIGEANQEAHIAAASLLLSDLTRFASTSHWRSWLSLQVCLDPSLGVTWNYEPEAAPNSVACWTLRDAWGKSFCFTHWKPEFDGLTRPTKKDGYLAIDNLPSDPTEALLVAVLATWSSP